MKSKIIIKLIDISLLQIPFHFYFKNVKIYFRHLRYVHEYAKSSYIYTE